MSLQRIWSSLRCWRSGSSCRTLSVPLGPAAHGSLYAEEPEIPSPDAGSFRRHTVLFRTARPAPRNLNGTLQEVLMQFFLDRVIPNDSRVKA